MTKQLIDGKEVVLPDGWQEVHSIETVPDEYNFIDPRQAGFRLTEVVIGLA